MNGNGPYPRIVLITKGSQANPLFREHLHLFIASCSGNVLAIREVAQAQGIEG